MDEDERAALAAANLLAWREKRLLEMGCTPARARELALLPWWQLDVHRFEELLEHSCPPALAAEILA